MAEAKTIEPTRDSIAAALFVWEVSEYGLDTSSREDLTSMAEAAIEAADVFISTLRTVKRREATRPKSRAT